MYDNNGKSAGLALVSLVSGPEGRMTQGDTRMVMTERARGAVLQRSQTGNTIVVSELAAALDAVRNNPKDGVVWQTGEEPPSSWLLKVSGGVRQDEAQRIMATLSDGLTVQPLQDELARAEQVRQEEAGRSKPEETTLIEPPQEDRVKLRPDEIDPVKTAPLNPDAGVLASVRESENREEREQAAAERVRSEVTQPDKSSGEQERASRVIADLANSERDLVRAAEQAERGRMPEHDEQTLNRTIQKER
ncbi:conjugative transfer relaxase/helicase TraI domain-containing protein [Enterobacter sp. MALB-1]|uniref:conjugative transfer relaxase/helicase TraI domain-containing protein n=1 Tax=Enterobacter sp. MALB-1 TaxID=3153561 RepID=UPI0034DAD7D0